MREIKFRAWLKETKEMIPVYQIDFNNGIINSESAWRMESEYILEQFTGLYDKNGVEIFEGDILQITWTNETFTDGKMKTSVIFWQGNFCHSGSMEPLWPHIVKDHYEIIGNIHDNPELLEVTE